MRRRSFLAIALLLAIAPKQARADDFITLTTSTVRGDPSHLGWSKLRVGFRVQFPAPASGRRFMQHQYEIIGAVERELARTRFDPAGNAVERERLERVIDSAVRRAAPRDSVTRVYDFRIEASE